MALAEPALVIADAERGRRIAAGGRAVPIVTRPVDGPLDIALGPILGGGTKAGLPAISPDGDATIGATRRRPVPRSPAAGISAPAISAISAPTAICSSSVGPRTSSSAAARTSSRRRWAPPSTPTPPSPRRPSSPSPTSGWARCRSRWSAPRPARGWNRRSCWRSWPGAWRSSSCRSGSGSRPRRCRSWARARSTRRARCAAAATGGRPPPVT